MELTRVIDVRNMDPDELCAYYRRTASRQDFVETIVKEKAISFPDRADLHRYWDIIDATVDMEYHL